MSYEQELGSQGRISIEKHHFGTVPIVSFDALDQKYDISIAGDGSENQPTRQLLNRFLLKIAQSDLPGKEQFSEYLRRKYRRNHKPNTFRTAFQSLKLFLSFYKKAGKAHLEAIARKDLEAFVENEQDRDLKPATVKTRLRCASRELSPEP